MAAGDVTAEGERLIKEWLDAKHRLDQARKMVTNGEEAFVHAQAKLARWLLPGDAKMGEKIAVWSNDSLIQAEVTSIMPLDGKVTVRSRGRYLGGERIG